MAYPQVIIPPSVKPVSPLELTLADDLTTPFAPRFGRGTTQRQTWGDPVWSAQVRFEGMSGADRALLKAALMGARGGASNILMTPGIPLRGSFPATELLTNNDFSNGTTGWSGQNATLSEADRVLRAKPTWAAANPGAYQAVTLAANTPYVGRSFASSTFSGLKSIYLTDFAGNASAQSSTASPAMKSAVIVPTSSGAGQLYPSYISASTGWSVSDIIDVSFASVSRCAQIDNGPNSQTYSDQFNNAAWTATEGTVTADAAANSEGESTADGFTESVVNTQHYISASASALTVPATADYTLSIEVKQGSGDRDLRVAVGNTGAGNYGECVFDLSAGTKGTASVAGTVTNARAEIKSKGNGWYFCSVTARIPSGVAVVPLFQLYNAGSPTYAGSGGSVYLWRACLAQSSFPTRGAQTTSAATTGTAQTGRSLYLKGLPVSTSGLLLAGDFFEINGELKQATASLDSDAAGLGLLSFAPGLTVAPADNDPVIFLNPMGRFRLAQDPRITERFGVYTDVDLALIEATA